MSCKSEFIINLTRVCWCSCSEVSSVLVSATFHCDQFQNTRFIIILTLYFLAITKKTNLVKTIIECTDDRTPARIRKNPVYKNFIQRHIPITKWLPNYNKFYAISDLIAGITLGLTMIPQSIAYAALAGLTPQYGLYSSFLGGFIYIFFGTIKEVSIGATSLMSLVTVEYTHDMPVDFVVLLTFLAGVVELSVGIINLGFLVDFISIPVTSGFTSATSIIIIASQLPGLFGLKCKSENIIGGLLQLYDNRKNVLLNDTILGFTCIIILLSFRKLRDIDCSRIKNQHLTTGLILEKILWFLSISRNASVVFIASFITFYQQDSGKSLFVTSGNVLPGLPPFAPPPFTSHVGNTTYHFTDMCSHLGFGIVMVPLVAVLTNVAIAKAFVRDGPVEATQEMLTLGVCNIAGSFVSSLPTCGAFTRSAVASASGIQTPLAGLYSGIMALLALSFLTPYFGFIPKATLSAVLISAVIFLIDWRICKTLWKGSKRDMFAAGSTFIMCLFFNVETGLLFGTVSNAVFLLYLSARPTIEIHPRHTVNGDKYVIVKPEIGLFYPAIAYLTSKITQVAENEANSIYPIVVDFERLHGIDYTAAKGIERLIISFEQKSQLLIFLNVSQSTLCSINDLSAMDNFTFINNEEGLIEIFNNIRKKKALSSVSDKKLNDLEKNLISPDVNVKVDKDISGSHELEALLVPDKSSIIPETISN